MTFADFMIKTEMEMAKTEKPLAFLRFLCEALLPAIQGLAVEFAKASRLGSALGILVPD